MKITNHYIAKHAKTGLYFNGVNFGATSVSKAKQLRAENELECLTNFARMWNGPFLVCLVDVFGVPVGRWHALQAVSV